MELSSESLSTHGFLTSTADHRMHSFKQSRRGNCVFAETFQDSDDNPDSHQGATPLFVYCAVEISSRLDCVTMILYESVTVLMASRYQSCDHNLVHRSDFSDVE